MATLTITGVHPYDGDYPLDFEAHPLKMKEWATIKRVAGVLAGGFQAALQGGDVEVVVALAVILLQRSGHQQVNEHALWESELGQITVTGDEADARPPDETISEPNAEPRAFWDTFRREWGRDPGDPPESYWHAGLGHWCHLRPGDIGELTPFQLDGCRTFMVEATKAR